MQNLRLQQKLLQKLSPQQILLMKLLQIPSIALEQRIKQEIEENPALDDSNEAEEVTDEEENDDFENEGEDESTDEFELADDEFDLNDYLNDEDMPSYKLNSSNTSPDNEPRDIPFVSAMTFHDFLISQLGLRVLSERDKQIALTIIGNLDDSGYIHRELNALVDDLIFSQNITTTSNEILSILKIIQEFDPPGVGARNLQECILIQLMRNEDDNPAIANAKLIIQRYFNEFTKKHYDKILKKSKMSEQELKDAINEILKLNPKPGNSLSETTKTNYYIIPDFIIHNNDGELELTLNSKNAPELRLSKTYVDMLEAISKQKSRKSSQQKDAMVFIKQKIDSAKWFIDAIKQRQHTLYITMNAIMIYQSEYFQDGDETKLRPMILKDIAEIVKLDISTISRVANSKYVQTPFGTFLLKSFFSESLTTDSGEEVSTREIKKILMDCIESENKSKPMTDEQLTAILKEKSYNIARRTVAKYREQLNIPVARLRKEL